MRNCTIQPCSWKTVAGVIFLLGLHAFLALIGVSGKSITVDEIFHVTGGYLFDRYGDYRIHSDNGVLPQRLHALPATLMGAKPPPFEGNSYWGTADVSMVSHQFFYESGNDHWPMLMAARAMNLLFNVGTGVLVFFWTRQMAGEIAGFVALGLVALSPSFLAHGPLATSDAAAAFLLPASAGIYWWQLNRPSGALMIGSAIVFGLACVAKFSAVVLLPVFAILITIHSLTNPPDKRHFAYTAVSLAFHAVVAWAIIWMCFGFRYAALAPNLPGSNQFSVNWMWMLEQMAWQGKAINLLREWRIFPEGFLFGYSHAYVGAQTRGAFLAGEYSTQGWLSFFPKAFAWKSTPAELTGLVLALLASIVHWKRVGAWMMRLAPLLVFSIIYGAFALSSHLNIGHRHLLPLYPGICLVTGLAAARAISNSYVRWTFAGLLVAVQGLEVARIHPNYLAYFNNFAGGPSNGWRLLVDSSLDWGQDLPALKSWLQSHNSGPQAQPVFLSYFGSGEPDYYGLKVTRLPFLNGFRSIHPWYQPKAGIYCISATILQQVYSPGQGEWTLAFEQEYQTLRTHEPLFREYWNNPSIRSELKQLGQADGFEKTWSRYDLMRMARLTTYLRTLTPTAMIGYSILVYQLTDADVDIAVNLRYSDLINAIPKNPLP